MFDYNIHQSGCLFSAATAPTSDPVTRGANDMASVSTLGVALDEGSEKF